jgi:hypothetical protein
VLRGAWPRHATRDHFFALGKLGAHHFDNGFGTRRVWHIPPQPGSLQPRTHHYIEAFSSRRRDVSVQVELLEP